MYIRKKKKKKDTNHTYTFKVLGTIYEHLAGCSDFGHVQAFSACEWTLIIITGGPSLVSVWEKK